MLFQTIQFFAFFAVFFAAYVLLQRHRSWQNALIVLGSYIFYGAWDERFLVLIIASTAMDSAEPSSPVSTSASALPVETPQRKTFPSLQAFSLSEA